MYWHFGRNSEWGNLWVEEMFSLGTNQEPLVDSNNFHTAQLSTIYVLCSLFLSYTN